MESFPVYLTDGKIETQRVQCPSELVTEMGLEPKFSALKQVIFFPHQNLEGKEAGCCWRCLGDRSCLEGVGQWEKMQQKPHIWPVSCREKKDPVSDGCAFHTHSKNFKEEGLLEGRPRVNWSLNRCFWRIQGGKRSQRAARRTPTRRQGLCTRLGAEACSLTYSGLSTIPARGKSSRGQDAGSRC